MIDFSRILSNSSMAHCLDIAGWTPERSIDTSKYQKFFETEGFTITYRTIEILQSFGGLRINPLSGPQAVFGSGPINFEPILAGEGEQSYVEYRERQIGLKLTPLGEWDNLAMLLIADDGQVISDAGNMGTWRVDRDFESALELLILADRRTERLSLPELA